VKSLEGDSPPTGGKFRILQSSMEAIPLIEIETGEKRDLIGKGAIYRSREGQERIENNKTRGPPHIREKGGQIRAVPE